MLYISHVFHKSTFAKVLHEQKKMYIIFDCTAIVANPDEVDSDPDPNPREKSGSKSDRQENLDPNPTNLKKTIRVLSNKILVQYSKMSK